MIEIIERKGKPEIILSNSNKPKRFKGISCSISYDGRYTIGIAIIGTD